MVCVLRRTQTQTLPHGNAHRLARAQSCSYALCAMEAGTTRKAPGSNASWPSVQGLRGEPLLGPFYRGQWADSPHALPALRARASRPKEILTINPRHTFCAQHWFRSRERVWWFYMAAFSVATFITCSVDAARAWTGSAQFFGAALNAGTDSKQTYHSGGGVAFATYFNQFTEDASMGWDQLQPNENDFSTAPCIGSLVRRKSPRISWFRSTAAIFICRPAACAAAV